MPNDSAYDRPQVIPRGHRGALDATALRRNAIVAAIPRRVWNSWDQPAVGLKSSGGTQPPFAPYRPRSPRSSTVTQSTRRTHLALPAASPAVRAIAAFLRVLRPAERESQKTGIDGLCVFKPKGICTEIR